MTSQETGHGRFQRAIRDRDLRRAAMAARELGQVSLADALALTLLAAELEDERWPRAAARWLGRFVVESPAITINEAALAAPSVRRGVTNDFPLIGHAEERSDWALMGTNVAASSASVAYSENKNPAVAGLSCSCGARTRTLTT
jgi:hypothetical protein